VCRVLTDAGFRALFVGGCVRNTLLGTPVRDIDIATDARPETVSTLAEQAGLKVIPTGIEHGTVTLVADGLAHEVTTFRRDVETDGRRAVVAFTDRVEEDALRRDLTMNALYAEADGTVVDPLGGLEDLAARRIRFIENAEDRIREDYLRILRFFRFHAWYGDPDGGLDPDGLAACAALVEGLDGLSKERVGSELLKLLAAPDPAPAAAAFQATGGLPRLLPGADTRALPVLVALEQEQRVEPDPVRRLAALGGHGHAAALRLSRRDARRLRVTSDAVSGVMGPAELGYRLGRDMALDIVLLRAALMELPVAASARAEIAKGAIATFPVSAVDLDPGVQGAAIGEKLRALETIWIAEGFEPGRDDLLMR